MSKFATTLIIFCSLSANLSGDEVSLTGGFSPYETYYIGSIDLETGSTNVPIFSFLLSAPQDSDGEYRPITFNAEFIIEILSPELGYAEKTTMIHLKTIDKIEMTNPIRLENKDFNKDTREIYHPTLYMRHYNQERFHSSNGDMSPVNFENSQIEVSCLG